ncbi:MAG: hypothetical protein K6F92_01765 [Lachnospiraceae bacterium]|nr:hypothetical protein [Lachnospiraceae bacterium]
MKKLLIITALMFFLCGCSARTDSADILETTGEIIVEKTPVRYSLDMAPVVPLVMDRECVFCMAGLEYSYIFTVNKEEYGYSVIYSSGPDYEENHILFENSNNNIRGVVYHDTNYFYIAFECGDSTSYNDITVIKVDPAGISSVITMDGKLMADNETVRVMKNICFDGLYNWRSVDYFFKYKFDVMYDRHYYFDGRALITYKPLAVMTTSGVQIIPAGQFITVTNVVDSNYSDENFYIKEGVTWIEEKVCDWGMQLLIEWDGNSGIVPFSNKWDGKLLLQNDYCCNVIGSSYDSVFGADPFITLNSFENRDVALFGYDAIPGMMPIDDMSEIEEFNEIEALYRGFTNEDICKFFFKYYLDKLGGEYLDDARDYISGCRVSFWDGYNTYVSLAVQYKDGHSEMIFMKLDNDFAMKDYIQLSEQYTPEIKPVCGFDLDRITEYPASTYEHSVFPQGTAIEVGEFGYDYERLGCYINMEDGTRLNIFELGGNIVVKSSK